MERMCDSETAKGRAREAPARHCDHPGCDRSGEYRAPRSRERLNSYYWFCLDHVRAYNAAWDYYAGMSTEEIEGMLRQDVTWRRPTWRLGTLGGGRRFRFDSARMHDPFGFFAGECEGGAPVRRAPSAEEQAVRVLGLDGPFDLAALKARYKQLVKRHHPDANNGSKAAEERFKEINRAYNTLRASLGG